MIVRQPISPLDFRTPIVDPRTGNPTLQYIQLFQRLYSNEDLSAGELADLTAAIATLEASVLILEGAQVPAGGATGEVLTKTSATDYDMEWAPSAGAGGIYAPMVTGALPGPELLATGDGQCIMAQIG